MHFLRLHAVNMLPGPSKSKSTDNRFARPFCDCTKSRMPMPWQQQLQELELVTDCACGEEDAGKITNSKALFLIFHVKFCFKLE